MTVRQAAFASGGGFTAAENGLAAPAFGLVVILPFAAYTLWIHQLYFTDVTVARLLILVSWSAGPALCAYVYGYFYPLLRGTGPVTKALTLFAAYFRRFRSRLTPAATVLAAAATAAATALAGAAISSLLERPAPQPPSAEPSGTPPRR
ncbi:hypothetical protein [Nonomuraea typhae]|uniref:hypothetical protein n=1 Tax=Nonomuraea typhae TaxID=2603600 RepID=UPI0012FB2B9E|nr:hypothetical protein [Nonomuraea typhae]